MDELKLDTWRKRFDEEANKLLSAASVQKDDGSNRPYELLMDESDELIIQMNDKLPEDIKQKFKQMLIATKPEDSV